MQEKNHLRKSRRRQPGRGFTLIELLVVVLILQTITAVALPAYITSVQTARQNTANANARQIAIAVQAKGITTNAYDTVLSDYNTDMGGAMPINPCTGANPDYTITSPTSTTATVTAIAGTLCGTWSPSVYSITL